MLAVRSRFLALCAEACTLGAVAGNVCMLLIAIAAAAIAARALFDEPHAFAWAHEALAQEVVQASPVARQGVDADDGARPDLLAADHRAARSRTRKAPANAARSAAPAAGCVPAEATPAPTLLPRELGDYPRMPVGAAAVAVG